MTRKKNILAQLRASSNLWATTEFGSLFPIAGSFVFFLTPVSFFFANNGDTGGQGGCVFSPALSCRAISVDRIVLKSENFCDFCGSSFGAFCVFLAFVFMLRCTLVLFSANAGVLVRSLSSPPRVLGLRVCSASSTTLGCPVPTQPISRLVALQRVGSSSVLGSVVLLEPFWPPSCSRWIPGSTSRDGLTLPGPSSRDGLTLLVF